MSIILKGIDMPKEKDEALLLLILGDGTVAEKIDSDRYEEMTDTQAIQILKPHGRLIDADETRTQYYQTMNELLQSTTTNMSVEALSLLCGLTLINNAPTILDEEGK